MSHDSYPPGMSTSDLIHVGEIEDPFDEFYEKYEPSVDQLTDFVSDRAEDLVNLLIEHKAGIKLFDIEEWWKEENVHIIQEEFERQ